MAYAVLGARPNSHPFQERKVDLKEPVKIGRAVAKCKSSANNLIFDCKVLSRSHAVIWYEDGKFFIQDTKSSNGTYVNSTQVGRASDDSESLEIKSGDILQFGVDVTENSKKVTHGCIIATVTLIHPDGTEALPETDSQTSRILPLVEDKDLKAQELWQLSRYLQEALNREQMLEQKLATMQRMIENSSAASEETLQAFVREDELLSRLDILENELDIVTKETNEENSKKLLLSLEEEKECYEKQAKETIKRLLQEKVDALQKLTDVQRSLSYSEDECSHMKGLNEKNETDIKELMERHEQRSKELQNLQERLDTAFKTQKTNAEQVEKEKRKLKNDLEEAEKRGSTLAVQIESLQAECDFTKKQLTSVKEKLEKNQSNASEKTDEKLLGASDVSDSVDSSQNIEGLSKLQTCLLRVKDKIDQILNGLKAGETDTGEFTPLVTELNNADERNISDASTSDPDNRKSGYDYVVKCCEEINDIEEKMKALSSFLENYKSKKEIAGVDSESEVENLREEIIQLNEIITNEQGVCQKYKELAEKFEERLEELQKNVIAQESKEISYEKELPVKMEDDESLQNENESLKMKIQSMDSELSRLKEENENLRLSKDNPEDLPEAEKQLASSELLEEAKPSEGYSDDNNEGKDKKISNVQGTSQLLLALVVIFIAFGAAILLDVINISFGNSPMLDPVIWREIYENLF